MKIRMFKLVTLLSLLGAAYMVGDQSLVGDAQAQGKSCPEARILADGRCCPTGQRVKEDGIGATCEADPNAKKGGKKGKKTSAEQGEAPREAARPASCEAGKERNEDTAGRCCYAGQVWASGRCVGLIAASMCPSGYKLTSDKQDCEEAGCSGGKKKLGVGQCCWEGQAWSKVAGKCVGAPQCPPSYKASGEDCRAPVTVPADYVRIPAGSFTMGSMSSEAFDNEKVVHRVTISRGFFMKKTEVTQGEWRSVMGSNPSDCDYECSDNRPVNMVSWEDSLRYLNKLSEREGLEACYTQEGGSWRWVKGLECEGYRLPTEAEWEYAAQGGTTGERYGSLDSIAWYSDNSGRKTKPVGTKTANVYGLYDMLGNVWEWTWDAYGAYSSGDQEDPIGGGLEQQDTSASRVYRGCGWSRVARLCRAANRFWDTPGYRDGNLGLRPARSDR